MIIDSRQREATPGLPRSRATVSAVRFIRVSEAPYSSTAIGNSSRNADSNAPPCPDVCHERHTSNQASVTMSVADMTSATRTS